MCDRLAIGKPEAMEVYFQKVAVRCVLCAVVVSGVAES
jgi:hypothetical protein